MLGAKAYLARHQAEFENCALLFNMDTVGGDKAIFVEMRGGVRGVPKKLESQLPKDLTDKATNDLEGRWMLLGPDQRALLLSSNVPDWLRGAISDAGRDLGLEITAANGMGSDHRVFMQAGIVATNIAVSGARTHSPDDVPASVSAGSLEKAARIVAAVVEKAGRGAK
jgi:Zn-dependent M28 family amino/carboxypeptidase